MSQLIMGFCGEGLADYRFLERVVVRTVTELAPLVEVFSFSLAAKIDQDDRARLAALKPEIDGYSLVVYHRDADAAQETTTYNRLISAIDHNNLTNIVPIIPIRNTEAWMMADPSTFGTLLGLRTLDRAWPTKPHQVEHVQESKRLVEQAITQAQRDKSGDRPLFFEQLGEEIRLRELEKVPAYGVFRQRLTAYLIQQRYLVP